MPLKAMDLASREIVYAWDVAKWDLKTIEEKRKNGDFVCPFCKADLTFRMGRKKIPHFAHKPNRSCHFKTEPETVQHELMKFVVAKWFKDMGKKVDVEVRIGDHIADVVAEDIVVEVQYSHIGCAEARQRTHTYTAHNYYTMWLFHPKHIEWRKWFIVRSSFRRLLIYWYHSHLCYLDPNTEKIGVYKLRKHSDGYDLRGCRYAVLNKVWEDIHAFRVWKYAIDGVLVAKPVEIMGWR